MIADDEPYIVKGLAAIIKNSGTSFTEVAEAADGFDALEKMKEFRPDLLITDISMPEMDGFELIKRSEDNGYCHRFAILTMIFVLFITIYPFYYILIMSFNDGIDGTRGGIYLFPRVFSLENYSKIFSDSKWVHAIFISVARTISGTFLGVLVTGMMAYGLPYRRLLSKATDNKQLPVLIASEDLPDFVYTDQIFERMSTPQVSLALDELSKKFSADLYTTPVEIANNSMPDGHFYGLRNVFYSQEEWDATPQALPSPGTRSLGYRQDIMEKLGNPPLNNFQDFEKVLKQVKEMFPEMTPLIYDTDYGFMFFSNQMGMDVGDSYIYEADGKIQYRLNHPMIKDVLKYMNSYYRQGFIDPESLSYKYEQFQQVTNSGKAFAYIRSSMIAEEVNDAFKNAKLDYKAAVATHEMSDKSVFIQDGIGWASLFISKNNKNPERAIQFLSFMRSEQGRRLSTWGIEGRYYTLNSEGIPQFTDEINAPMSSDEFFKEYGRGLWIFGTKMEEAIMLNDPTKTDMTARLKSARSITKVRPILNFCKPVEGDEMVIYNKLNELFDTQSVRIILSKTDDEFEKNYDQMMKNAEKIGMTKLNDWMTSKYNEVKDKY